VALKRARNAAKRRFVAAHLGVPCVLSFVFQVSVQTRDCFPTTAAFLPAAHRRVLLFEYLNGFCIRRLPQIPLLQTFCRTSIPEISFALEGALISLNILFERVAVISANP